MSLDSKLKEILQDYDHDTLQQEGIMDEIKQAFADEGYKKVIDISPDIALWGSKRLMTGEKWYSRFEKEMIAEFNKPIPESLGIIPEREAKDLFIAMGIEAAAKKASGL